MATYLPLILTIPAVAMAVEDFRYRKVSLLWLIIFSAGTLGCALYAHSGEALRNILLNTLLLLLLGSGTILFLTIRKGKISPRDYIGAGDIIYLLAVTPLFGTREYVVFLIISMLFSLAWWLAVRLIRKKNVTIPMVGTMGTLLCLYFLISVL